MGNVFSCVCVPGNGESSGQAESAVPSNLAPSKQQQESGTIGVSVSHDGPREAIKTDEHAGNGEAEVGLSASKGRTPQFGDESSFTSNDRNAQSRQQDQTSTETPMRSLSLSYIDVLRDPTMTTIGTATATTAGAAVGLMTLSGLLGAFIYLITLLVFYGGVLFVKGKKEPTNKAADVAKVDASQTKEVNVPGDIAPIPKPTSTGASSHGSSKDSSQHRPRASTKQGTKSYPEQKYFEDNHTSQKFPYVMDEHDGYPDDIELLSALGIREKKILLAKLDIYALGIYVNVSEVKEVLGKKYGDLSREALEKKEDILEDIINATDSISRTIRIVIHFAHLTSAMLVSSFDERLEKVMKNAGEMDVYNTLRNGLGSVELSPGTTILLRMKIDGTLVASSGKAILANSKSHTLCKAVTDIYLGKEAASLTVKHDFMKRIYDILHLPEPKLSLSVVEEGKEDTEGSEPTGTVDTAKSTSTDLSGKWKVIESENVQQLLAELGINIMIRTIAHNLYTNDVKLIEQADSTVTFIDYRNNRKGSPVVFKEKETRTRLDKQGRMLTEITHWEGNKLKVKTSGYKNTLYSTYWRESDDTMRSETQVNKVVMRRKWILVTE